MISFLVKFQYIVNRLQTCNDNPPSTAIAGQEGTNTFLRRDQSVVSGLPSAQSSSFRTGGNSRGGLVRPLGSKGMSRSVTR